MQEALYRRYRPSTLEQLIGQSEAVTLISKQIENDNLSHAFLFSGPRGVGKTSLARIIASTIGCDPIFDITEIDAASHNKVDDIRELNESINFIASSPGKRRVFILDEVHMLSNAASNAFLKTLEEPPAHIIFILATTEPDRVIETIKSRTTHIAFKRISNKDIISTLEMIGKKEQIKLDKNVIDNIANYSDGSLRDAINLYEQTFNTFGEKANLDDLYNILGKVSIEDLLLIINSMTTQDTGSVLSVLKQNYNKGLQPIDILTSITHLFRSVFYLKYLPTDSNFVNLSENEKKLVQDCNDLITAKQLARILDMLDDVNQQIKSSPSQELKLELFLIKLIKPQLATDANSIVRRLDLIEGQISHPRTQESKTPPPKLVTKDNEVTKKVSKQIEKDIVVKTSKKNSIENFDVYWPKILEEAKQVLTPRKYSYLTLVKPDIDDEKLVLFIEKHNEYLLAELNKADDIKEYIESSIAKKMGINVSVVIQSFNGVFDQVNLGDEVRDNINQIFDVKDVD